MVFFFVRARRRVDRCSFRQPQSVASGRRKPLQRRLERPGRQIAAPAPRKRAESVPIRLISMDFWLRRAARANLHAHPDSSKFATRRCATPRAVRRCAAGRTAAMAPASAVKLQLGLAVIRDANAVGEGARQVPANDRRQHCLRGAPRVPGRRASASAARMRQAVAGNACHAGSAGRILRRGRRRCAARVAGRPQLNIILVSGATARARTIRAGLAPLDARRPRAARASSSCFTLVFNFVTLRWAAANQHPVAAGDRSRRPARGSGADRRRSSRAISTRWRMRLGELQARMLRLDGLGERLAKLAGLEAAGIAVAAAGPGAPGAAARSRRRAVAATVGVPKFTDLLETSRAQVDERSDQLACSRRCWCRTPPTASSCRRWRRSSTAGTRRTSATGSTRSPGSNSFHEGIDFPAEAGTRDRRGGERQGRHGGVASPVW